jgi:glycosyltransferase involved in cell wall biosynthesis
MRLAYFSPLTPQRSGIADYSEELLPHLAASAGIDLFVDGFKPASESVRARFKIFDYHAEPRRLDRLRDYDAAVYQMGNDHRYHAGLYEVALAHPGVVVLHDFALQNFFLGLARERDDLNVYLDELEACHGRRARVEAEETLARGAAPSFYTQPQLFPLNCRLARHAEGLICHSEWARTRLARIAPATPVARVSLPVPREDEDATSRDDGAARRRRVRGVEIASFGFITTEKGIERTLAALASLRAEHEFHYTLVGEPDNFDVHELVRAHDLRDRVTVTGFVTLDEFKARMAASDIAINLRERTVGETSASVCRAMAAGLPVIVSNVGWFAELPDDCAIKVDAGAHGDAQLRAYLALLLADETLCRRIGENARRFAAREFAVEKTAADYLAFIRSLASQRTRRRFVGRVAGELARCGVRESDEDLLREVGAQVAQLARAFSGKERG